MKCPYDTTPISSDHIYSHLRREVWYAWQDALFVSNEGPSCMHDITALNDCIAAGIVFG